MERRGLSARRLAEVSGIHPNTINAWLRGATEPTPATLRLIAPHLGVGADELIRVAFAERPEPPILVPILPHYISAGPGTIPEYVAYWPRPGERSHQFVAIAVSGTCMEPRIHAGETVVVDTDASPKPGDIVAAEHRDEYIVKLLERRNGRLYLVAIQDEPPIEVNEETRILGVVVQVTRRP